tara:strand:- start:270 stop:443 length:174 start_codon:yes stop_codon:yes gene_type:complete
MIFLSNPSVYTLPGTWEAQPLVPVELIFSTTVAIATLGLVVGLMAGISIVKIRRKRA